MCVHFGNGFKPQAETHERSKQLWCKCMNENDDDMEEKPKVFPELPGLISYVFVFLILNCFSLKYYVQLHESLRQTLWVFW